MWMMACYETCVDVGKRCSLSKNKIQCFKCGGLKPHYNLITEHTVARPGEEPSKRADKETRVATKEEWFDKQEEFFSYSRYKECKCKQSCWQWILSFLGFGAKLPECCKRVQLSVWDRGDVARAALASKFQEVIQRIGNRCKPQVRRTSQINLQEEVKDSGQPPTVVGVSAKEQDTLQIHKEEDRHSGSYLSYVEPTPSELGAPTAKHRRAKTRRLGSSTSSRGSAASTDTRRSRLLSAIASLKARSKRQPSSSSSGSNITEEKDFKVKDFFNPFKNRSFVRPCTCHKRFQALYCPQLPSAPRRRSKSRAPLYRSKEAPDSAKQRVRLQSSPKDQPSKKQRSCKQLQSLDKCVATSDRSPSSKKNSQPPCQTSDGRPSSSKKTCQPPCQTSDRSPSSSKKTCQTSDRSPSSSKKTCQTSDRSPSSSKKTCQPPCQEERDYKVIKSSSMPCTSCFPATKPFVSRFCRCEPELPCGGPKLPCRSQSFHSTMLRSPSPLAVVMPTSSPCCRPCAVSTGRPRCRRFKCSCPLDCVTRRSRSCSRPCCCPIKSPYCSPPPFCKSNRERSPGPYVDRTSPCNLDCCQLGNKPPITICPPCCTKPCCLPCPRKFNVFPYCPRIDATSKRYLSIPPCTMRAACPCPTGGPCTCPKAKHFPLPCCPYTPSATCRVACSTPSAISYIKSKQNDAICQRLLSKYGFSPPLCLNCPSPCYGTTAEGTCANLTPSCTSNFYSCAGTGSGGCRSCNP